MSDAGLPRSGRSALATLACDFLSSHLVIGLIGNLLFVASIALYMTEREDLGVLCFLTGSVGMLLGALEEAMRILGKHRLAKVRHRPLRGAQPCPCPSTLTR